MRLNPIIHHPTIIPFGPLTVTGFGIAVGLAFLIGSIICERELTRRGQESESRAIGSLVTASIFGTLIGGKLYFVFVITHDWHDLFNRAGFVFWGGFIGAVTACVIAIRRKHVSVARIADVAGIAMAAGYSVGRSGCWAIGDDYGKPYSGPFSVAFPQGAPPSTAGVMAQTFHIHPAAGVSPNTVLSVYPTQLMEVVLAFVMFLVLWRLRDHRHETGWLFGVYCVLAGAERFIIEFFRAKDDRFGFAAGLSTAQLIALMIVGVGAFVMYRLTDRRPPAGRAIAGAGLLLASGCLSPAAVAANFPPLHPETDATTQCSHGDRDDRNLDFCVRAESGTNEGR
jgi:phosphatidylglycerol:prolipoprotein diacylglycerol transferase